MYLVDLLIYINNNEDGHITAIVGFKTTEEVFAIY